MASALAQEVLREIMTELGPRMTELAYENRVLRSEIDRLKFELQHFRKIIGLPENSLQRETGALLRSTFESVKSSLVRDDYSSLSKHIDLIEQNFYRDLTSLMISESLTSAMFRRYISGFVYIDHVLQPKEYVYRWLVFVADLIDFDHVLTYPLQVGSWYRRFVFKSREALTHPEVAKRLLKLERALELQTIGKDRASINRSDAEAAALLIDALQSSERAIIRLGSLLIAKRPGADGKPCTIVRNLTEKELQDIENSPELEIERDMSLKLVESD